MAADRGDRLQRALDGIDALNREDPRREDGEPVELLYSRRMSERLAALEPDASDELRIAVAAQHVCRWRIPRSDYPMDRAGYKKWRSRLAAMHAELAAGVMAEVGYGDDAQQRARKILQKRELARDPEVQTLEDCACLVFLEHYFAAFAGKHDDDKIAGILRKTWKKMSARGHRQALELVPSLPDHLASLVQRAVAGGDSGN